MAVNAYKIFFLTIFLCSCLAHNAPPKLDIITLEEDPRACSSRMILGHSRNPCTTFQMVRIPGPPGHPARYYYYEPQ